jgi:hypothetical protein
MNQRHENAAVQVPCGKCRICLSKRQRDWIFRLEKELERSTSACFITLTYESPPVSQNGLFTLQSQDLTRFFKRLRVASKKHKIKYYAVGEYGSKFQRPHYHAIVFNIPRNIVERSYIIESIWHGGTWADNVKPGIIQVDACTSGSIGYVAGYCNQGTWAPDHCNHTGLIDDRRPHYSCMSKGLGANYLTPNTVKYHVENQIGFLQTDLKHIQRLPRYYRDKIFSRAEREQMAKEAAELEAFDLDQYFRNAEHQIEYIKTEQLKWEQKQKLERQSL